MENISSSNSLEKCPKLRFPEFTEPWTRSQLSKLFNKNTQKNSLNTVTNVISNSAKNGLIPQKDCFDKGIANYDNITGYYVIRKNDFVYNPRKSTDAPYGPISRYAYDDNGIVSPLYLCFRGNDNINPEFFEKYFKTPVWHRYIYMSGDSGARHDRVSIKDETFFEMPINLPHEKEQSKITFFLSLVEQRIEAQSALIENLKKYKRGLFETIFTQKIRVIKNGKSWTKVQLSEFANRITRKNGQQTDIPLTISSQYGLIDQRDFFSKVIASADMSGYYLLKNGEFAYNRSTSNEYPFGSIKRLEKYPMGAVSTLYLCFDIDTDTFNSDFIKLFFESSQWHRQISEICAEGARNHGLLNVPTDGFFNCYFILPRDMVEQETIAKFLTNIQLKLDSELLKLDLLTNIKKGLLQQLFI